MIYSVGGVFATAPSQSSNTRQAVTAIQESSDFKSDKHKKQKPQTAQNDFN